MEGDRRSPGAAFVLSLIPGVGHLYAGRVGSGIGWLAAVFVAYGMAPGLGLFAHFVCAAMAARAAEESNRAEREELRGRRESAADVARMLDRAAGLPGHRPAAAPPPPAADPPPRLMRAAFPVPAEALVRALADAMASQGLLVLGVDAHALRVRGSADLGGGRFTTAVAQVERTPAGSRVRLMVDRPPGSPMDPERDDAILRGLLEATERSLPAPGVSTVTGGAPAAAVVGAGEALTEDHFLEQLREAWESFDQGWLPEREWLQRRDSLVRSVVLRPGTRSRDLLAACRPLAEAGVLSAEDLATLEGRLGG